MCSVIILNRYNVKSTNIEVMEIKFSISTSFDRQSSTKNNLIIDIKKPDTKVEKGSQLRKHGSGSFILIPLISFLHYHILDT